MSSSVLADNLPRDGVSIKMLVWHFIITTLKMSEMSSDIIRNNGVNGTGTLREGPSPGRCPVGEQRRPGRHQKTARTGWSKEMNVAAWNVIS